MSWHSGESARKVRAPQRPIDVFASPGSETEERNKEMSMLKTTLLAACCAGLFVFGCNKGDDKGSGTETTSTTPATTGAATAAADPGSQAKKVFKAKCVVCHGDHGAGDGPGAAALNPKPRAFSAPDWQSSVDDDHIKKIIVQGGAAVGKSAAMPGNPDLRNKPEIVDELVKIIRAFKS
jgi:mono/diheme cytochrome c family protein